MEKAVNKKAKPRYPTKPVTVRLPVNVVSELESLVEPDGMGPFPDKTEIVRQAIIRFIEEERVYAQYPKYGLDEKGLLVVYHNGRYLAFKMEKVFGEHESYADAIKAIYPDGVDRLKRIAATRKKDMQ